MRALLLAVCLLAACQREPAANGTAAMRATTPPRPRREPRGPEHPIYSLADNRLYAHIERNGGLVVLPGGAGFTKYLRFGKPKVGWGPRQRIDERWAALADTYAPLSVPVTEEQAAAR